MLTMFPVQPPDAWVHKYGLAHQQRIVAAGYLRGDSYDVIAKEIDRSVNQVGAVVSDIRNKLPFEDFPYRKPGWDRDAEPTTCRRDERRHDHTKRGR